jgi:hypothetical protein
MCIDITTEDGIGGDNMGLVCLIGWSYYVTLLEGIVNINQPYLPLASSMHIQYLDISPHLSLEVQPQSYFPLGVLPDTSYYLAPFDPDEIKTWVSLPIKLWYFLEKDQVHTQFKPTLYYGYKNLTIVLAIELQYLELY